MGPLENNQINNQLFFDKLDDLSKKSFKKSLKKFFILIFSTLNRPFSNKEIELRTRIALRTQEHLLREGSDVISQRNIFINQLEKVNQTASISQLLKELKNFEERIKPPQPIGREMDEPFKVGYPYGQKNVWPQNQFEKLENLKEQEGIWLHLGTHNHCMIMRIKNEGNGKYAVQFVNAGLGILEHAHFHPSKKLEDGTTLYQTVAEIREVSKESLNLEFFNEIDSLAGMGGNENKVIKGIYDKLATLGIPVNIPCEEMPQYWSKPQIGGSCVPEALWAMSKLILTSNEVKTFKLESRMESLLTNYNKIRKGWDRSITTKILVLDQIQKLKKNLDDTSINNLFTKIEKDLLKKLNMKDVEVKIDSNHPIKLKGVKKNQITVKPKKALLVSKDSSLTAKFSMRSMEGAISYKFIKEGKTFVGEDIFDDSYLLYLAIASGKQEKSKFYLDRIMSNYQAMKLKPYSVDEKEKIAQTALLIAILAADLSDIDHTRSGIAKAQFLIKFAYDIESLTDYRFQNDITLDKIKLYSSNLHVEQYLTENNVWIEACKQL